MAALETETTWNGHEPLHKNSKALFMLTFLWADVKQFYSSNGPFRFGMGLRGGEQFIKLLLTAVQTAATGDIKQGMKEIGNWKATETFSLGTVKSAEWQRERSSLTADSTAEVVLHSHDPQEFEHQECTHCVFSWSWRGSHSHSQLTAGHKKPGVNTSAGSGTYSETAVWSG